MRAVVLSVTLACGCATGTGKTAPADLVFVGGPVYTRDASNPWAEALAIQADTIVYVGSRIDADAFIGESTRLVDLDGRLLLPKLDDGAVVEIHEAVTGRTLARRRITTDLMSVDDAVDAHTSGSFVVGAPADLTVLEENILTIMSERIAEAKVEMTMVRGELRYVAKTFDRSFSATLE